MITFSNGIHNHSPRISHVYNGGLFIPQVGIWHPLYGMNSPGFTR